MEDLKIRFFTDIHGSCSCFRKFLRLIEDQVDVLIIGETLQEKNLYQFKSVIKILYIKFVVKLKKWIRGT